MIAYLRSVEPTMAIPLRTCSSAEELVWKPVEEALRERDDAFMITPSRFVPLAKVYRIETPIESGFTIDVTATPALHYSRGKQLAERRILG
jgi:hypothetical protein